MKVIKPLKIGALHKTYSFQFTHYFVSAPVVFFDMGIDTKEKDVHSPYGVLLENLQWPLVQKQLGTQILDMVMPKQNAEIMLAGSAWNPQFIENPESNQDATVGIQMAEMEKRLTVKGNRSWNKGLMGYKLSKPDAWESVLIHDQTAYGGEGYQDNQLGVGYKTKDKQIIAPNIEDIDVAVRKPGKNIAPAGFGTIDVNHSQRAKYNGNYQSKDWLENHFPNLAPDTDFRLFQAARQDQQFNGYLRGDESYKLANLVKGHPLFEGTLPGVKARSFVQFRQQTSSESDNFYEIPLNLDTVWLFPDINLGAMIWHGQTETQELDGKDIRTSLLAYEALADQPRTKDHYFDEMLRRENQEKAIEAMLDDAPLSPLKTPEQLAAEQREIEEEIAEMQALQKEQQEQFIDDAKAANGGQLPPGFKTPELEKPQVLVSKKALQRGSFSGAAIMAEVAKQKAVAEQQQKEMEKQLAEAQELQEKQLKNLDPKKVTAIKEKGNVADKINELQEMSKHNSVDLDDEQLKLLEAQKFKAQQYSMTPISDWPEDEYADEKREIFLNALNTGEVMARRNWSGANLSNLELRDLDLSGCNLENCNLENTILDGANLSRVGLLGSKLSSASFKGCNLTEANLSSTVAQFTNFDGANLSQALMMKTNMENCHFKSCDMRLCVVFESRLYRCQFSSSQFTKLSIVNSTLVDSDLNGIEAEMFVVMNCQFDLSRLTQMKLERCAWLECQFKVCSFAQSELKKCQFSGDANLSGANMSQMKASQCGFRRINGRFWYATDSQLTECDLGDSDFHHGNFKNANLTRSVLSDARFMSCKFNKANFFGALLRATQLTNCQLKDSNFYQADALMAVVYNSDFRAAENLEPLTQRRWKRVS